MSANADPLDPMLKLQRLRVRLERNMPTPRELLIATLAHATNEIQRLRLANERLAAERRLIERAFGRSPRVGGA